MSIKIAFHPDGIVARHIFPTGEIAYLLNNDGRWFTSDYKGPWVSASDEHIPRPIRKAIASAKTETHG